MTRLRVLAAFAALALAGAAPPPAGNAQTEVVRNGNGPAMSIPPGSPVKFQRFDEDGLAHFSGRFVLTGTFAYWCEIGDCGPDEQPLTQDDLMMTIVVDPEVAERLPHWGAGSQEAPMDWPHMQIEIVGGEAKLVKAVVSPEELKALIAGKVPHVEGPIAIVVDNFAAGLSCDNSPFYLADFVRFASPAEVASGKVEGIDACP